VESIKRYLWNVLIGLDQLLNAVLGGDPDETISSRMGKQTHRCRLCRWVCRLLGKIDNDHCLKSIEPDRGKPWTKDDPGDAA